MNMDISTHELLAALPKLDDRTKQAIYIVVLEERARNVELQLALKDEEIARFQHQIEVLEEAVKMPEGFARTNHSTVHEEEFMDNVLEVRQVP